MSDTPSVATGLSVQRALNQDSELGYRLKGASVSGEHRAKTLCWALPDHERTGSWRNELKGETRFHVVLAACSLIVATCLAAWIVVLYTKLNSAHQSQTEGLKSIAAENRKDGAILPPCDDGWIWHQNKCYHFSEAQGNWTEAKDWCAALDSSLAVIDTQKELAYWTPRRLLKMGAQAVKNCLKCGEPNADEAHMFWQCPSLQMFWQNVGMTLSNLGS